MGVVDLWTVFGSLADEPRWVAWKRVRRDGDVTKVPVDPATGGNASSTDPTTWGTLEDALYTRDERGLAGVGIVLGDGLGGVDLDACRDPETGAFTGWAREVIDGFHTYSEVSPSGTGVKLFALGAPDELPAHEIPLDGPPVNGKRPGIEVYTERRFFTVTGRLLDGCPDEIRDAGEVGDGWDRMARLLQERGQGGGSDEPAAEVEGTIPAGSRNKVLTSLAGTMRRRGMQEAEIRAALLAVNENRCDPTLSEEEVASVARSVAGYDPERAPQGDAVRLAEVDPESVDWLWPARIPLGRMSILDGDPGLGKSAVALDLAARVSTGAPMPDGSPGLDSPAGVVLLSAEDGLADTIRPRLDAAGANVEKVAALRYVRDAAEKKRRLPTVRDVHAIEGVVRDVDAAFLVVDPLVAYLGADVNAHRDQDVRAGLAGLADLAERTGVAVLAIRHLRKSGAQNPVYAGGGSIGFIAAARSGLLLATEPDAPDSDRRVLASTKCNLAPEPPSLALRLTATDRNVLRVRWSGESDHDAAALLEREAPEQRSRREDAAHVLRVELSEGPRPVSELRHVADELGVSWRTVQRAADSIDVVKKRTGGVGAEGRWVWSLPDSENPKGEYPVALGGSDPVNPTDGKGSTYPDNDSSDAVALGDETPNPTTPDVAPYPDSGPNESVALENPQNSSGSSGGVDPYPDSMSASRDGADRDTETPDALPDGWTDEADEALDEVLGAGEDEDEGDEGVLRL